MKFRPTTSIIGLWLLLAATIGSTPLSAQPAGTRVNTRASRLEIGVTFAQNRQGLTITGRRLLGGSDVIYLPSHDVGTLFRGTRRWDENRRELNFRVRGHDFVLIAGSRLIRRDDDEILMRTPPLAVDGDLWVPLEFLDRIVGPAVGEIIAWDPTAPRLTVGSKIANITNLKLSSSRRSTSMKLNCAEPLGWRTDVPRPGLITMKIFGGVLGANVSAATGGKGLITGITATQYPDHALLEIEVRRLVSSYRTVPEENGRDIRLVLEEEPAGAIPAPQPRGQLNMAQPELLRAVGQDLSVQVVVIDAGHGGRDPGKIGVNGTNEKEINLALAKALRDELRDMGLRVVFTREKDEWIELNERAEIANRAGGDLFISLHCNGWFNEMAQGIETYFLTPSQYEQEDEDFVPWSQVQQKHLGQSSDLAETIQSMLIDGMGVVDRGVKQAGYQVLRGADMPAVLVEVGFLSNADEEENLRDSDYRRELARNIAAAINDFRRRYGAAANSGAGE